MGEKMGSEGEQRRAGRVEMREATVTVGEEGEEERGEVWLLALC